MSTRAAIARLTNEGFSGRYHHWDGYPSGLGATLYWLAQRNEVRAAVGLPPTPWDGDLDKMMKVLIDEHPAGWSTINGKDMRRQPGMADDKYMRGTCACGKDQQAHFCQYAKEDHAEGAYPCNGGKPVTDGFSNRHLGHLFEETEESKAIGADLDLVPECYCHGSRAEDAWEVTHENASDSGVEYAYVLNENTRHMAIASTYTEIDGESVKMIGFFGAGDPDAEWKPIAVVNLDDPEPDWEAIYNSQYPEEEAVEV